MTLGSIVSVVILFLTWYKLQLEYKRAQTRLISTNVKQDLITIEKHFNRILFCLQTSAILIPFSVSEIIFGFFEFDIIAILLMILNIAFIFMSLIFVCSSLCGSNAVKFSQAGPYRAFWNDFATQDQSDEEAYVDHYNKIYNAEVRYKATTHRLIDKIIIEQLI